MADWIERSDALRSLLDDAPATIGVDTEFMRIDTFLPKLALVQIEIGGRIALIDPTADVEPAALATVLGDPDRTCVMHSASEDLEAFATWSCSIARLFDTQIAASFAGLGAGLGYQKLVRELVGIDVPKAETRSDWLRRPLSAEQLEYAAQDVVHLPALHARLSDRVAQRGYGAWLEEDCVRLLDKARMREPDPDPQTGMRGAADWPLETQGLLRRVLIWRDLTARAINRPRSWLLDDAHALDLSARPPKTAEELADRCKGQRALRGAQRNELFDVLAAPMSDAELQFAPIPRVPTSREKSTISAMKDIVAARALALDLPEGLLCARRHLESLLATRRWPAALDGWRRAVLHDELVALLPD
ncbi:MAG: HRDC domain-containing protein [Dokdonella sp.]|uniref:ribonuclease D n=1 Tax=Dokdonella sp. TaxID=2291710 RepID=UPI003264FE08